MASIEPLKSVTISVFDFFLDNCQSIIQGTPERLKAFAITYLNILRTGCKNSGEIERVNAFCSDAFTDLYESFNHIYGYKIY